MRLLELYMVPRDLVVEILRAINEERDMNLDRIAHIVIE